MKNGQDVWASACIWTCDMLGINFSQSLPTLKISTNSAIHSDYKQEEKLSIKSQFIRYFIKIVYPVE